MNNPPQKTINLPWWVIAVIVITAAIAFSHARRYFRAFQGALQGDETLAESTTILQASLEDTTSDVLSEWAPLIVQDKLVDPEGSITSTLLRWQYVWKSRAHPVMERDVRTTCRFTVIFTSDEETIVLLKKTYEDPGVEIRLITGRTLILPPGLLYSVKGGYNASQVRFHDSSTLCLNLFAPSHP